MTDAELLARITSNPAIYGGKPIIRGLRFAVEHVLDMLAAGDTPEDIVASEDLLDLDDIHACLLFAANAVRRERFRPAPALIAE
jgi:uncharacterized protein (DUF433 family)